ncbi:MAG: tetratricopeptide repeat protein [Pyrinomonadaceae bacterium]
MPEQLIHIDARKATVRIGMIVGLVLAIVWTTFTLRWYLGNTLAENVENLQLLQTAESLSPKDPLTHWSLAQFTKQELPTNDLNYGIREYEAAVALSPHDYRLWMSLGIALEQAGDDSRAEHALRTAVSLAPSYSYPHWYLGNALLRSNRFDEAFAELRVAGDSNGELRTQLFILAWEVYGANIDSLLTAVGATPQTRAEFALYLLGRGRIDDGIRLWRAIDAKDKRLSRFTGDQIMVTLMQANRFHDALDVWNDLAPDDYYRGQIGAVLGGDFEGDLVSGSDTAFGWQVTSSTPLQIGIDNSVGHDSRRSLRLNFHVRSTLEEIQISQLIAVSPATDYVMDFYVKTSSLETAMTPYIEIFDAANKTSLGSSEPAPNGDNDWQHVVLPFKTGDKTEAIRMHVTRSRCPDNIPVCPIFGTVWYDDFSLKRRS